MQCKSRGGAVETKIDEREQKIIDIVDPILRKNGVFLYGIDTLINGNGERVLSEINTLNVGGIKVLEDMQGKPLTAIVAKEVAKLHKAHCILLQNELEIKHDGVHYE